jgi:hypothetical protein
MQTIKFQFLVPVRLSTPNNLLNIASLQIASTIVKTQMLCLWSMFSKFWWNVKWYIQCLIILVVVTCSHRIRIIAIRPQSPLPIPQLSVRVYSPSSINDSIHCGCTLVRRWPDWPAGWEKWNQPPAAVCRKSSVSRIGIYTHPALNGSNAGIEKGRKFGVLDVWQQIGRNSRCQT